MAHAREEAARFGAYQAGRPRNQDCAYGLTPTMNVCLPKSFQKSGILRYSLSSLVDLGILELTEKGKKFLREVSD